jgi:hypothetical protein
VPPNDGSNNASDCPRPPGLGSHTSLTLFLAAPTRDPAKPHTAGWDYRVRCLGRTVRVDPISVAGYRLGLCGV